MNKSVLIFVMLSLSGQLAFSQEKSWNETEQQRIQRMKWWTEARFGMFIHWSTSSGVASYDHGSENFDIFNPDLYNAREWARIAKNTGMKYAVITAKHHNGFCLWDSDQTDYTSVNTPYGKDLLKPFVEAFRDEGLRVGFYYSGPDRHHPHYPGRGQEDKPGKEKDMEKYVAFMYKQIRELMTGFGQIDIYWMDYGNTVATDENELLNLIRGLQPQIILNDRLFQPDLLSEWGWKWDYRSPEQTMPDKWITMEGKAVPWEICHTLNGYWHYKRDVQNTNRYGWKSKPQLIAILIEAVSKGGNLLLNVSPTPRGRFDDQTMELLNGIGEWMDRHGRSIYGCTAAPERFKAPANTLLTFNPETNRLYVHILAWPTRLLHLGEYYYGKVEKARFLHDGSEIEFSDGQGYWDWVWTGDVVERSERGTLQSLTLELPIVKPGVEIPVIELFLE